MREANRAQPPEPASDGELDALRAENELLYEEIERLRDRRSEDAELAAIMGVPAPMPAPPSPPPRPRAVPDGSWLMDFDF